MVILALLAAACLAADPTNTIVTASVTGHRITAAGSMEPGGGFYLYQTDFVVTVPTNYTGIVLTMESFGSDARLSKSNAVVEIDVPTASLKDARSKGKPHRIEPSQIKIKTESNKPSEGTR